MDYKKIALGLGVFSVALGAIELFGSRRITRTLGVEGHETLIKAFGARELAAGAALLSAPAVGTNMWMRVGGDVLDLGALAIAAKASPRNGAVWGAIAFVIGATLLDAVTAQGLDRTTGKTWPIRNHAAA